MSKQNTVITNFSLGKIGKKSFGRTDLEGFKNGAEEFNNILLHPQGGFGLRPSTSVEEDGIGRSALIPFTSTTQEYFIIKLNPAGLSTSNTDISFYDFNSTSPGITLFNTLDPQASRSVFYRTIGVDAGGTWTNLSTSFDIHGFTYTQVGDVLILTHNSEEMVPLAIVYADGDFYVDCVTYPYLTTSGGKKVLGSNKNYTRVPYKDPNIDGDLIMTPSATTGTGITIDCTGPAAAPVAKSYFTANHAGTYMRLTQGSTEGVVIIKSINSATQAVADVIVTLGGTTATTNWMESLWGDDGYPRVSTYYEERMVYGGTKANPDYLMGSVAGNIYVMMERRLLGDTSLTSVPDDHKFSTTDTSVDTDTIPGRQYLPTDAFTFPIGSNEVNYIRWMTSKDSVLIGTDLGEYTMDGGDTFLGRHSVKIKRNTTHGSSGLRAVQAGSDVLFCTGGGKKIRSYRYVRENGSYKSGDLNFLADDIFAHEGGTNSYAGSSFTKMVYDADSHIVWVLTSNHILLSLTLDVENDIMAWSTHDITGADEVVSMAVLPSAETNRNNLFLNIKRTIDSTPEYHLEQIRPMWDEDNLDVKPIVTNYDAAPWFLDAAEHQLIPAVTSTLTLTYKSIGDTVYVINAGVVSGPYTVDASHQITIDTPAAANDEPIIGYLYKGRVKTLRFDVGSPIGSSVGNMRKLDRVTLDMYKTQKLKVGSTDANLESVDKKELFTGYHINNFIGGPTLEPQVIVESVEPGPFSIRSIALRGNIND